MKIILVVLFLIVSVLNIYSQKNTDKKSEYRNHYIKLLTKPLLIPLLICIYILSTVSLKAINIHLIIALLFAWIGDIVLMKPNIKRSNNHSMKPLMIALLFFFCGHITYFTLFIKSSINLANKNTIYILIYLIYIAYCFVIFTYLSSNGLLSDKNKTLSRKLVTVLKLLILVYMIGFSLMSYTSLLRLINLKSIGAIFTFVGSIMFITSDSVLGLKRFGQKSNLSEQYIMLSYITAQSLIVIGYII